MDRTYPVARQPMNGKSAKIRRENVDDDAYGNSEDYSSVNLPAGWDADGGEIS